MEFSAVNCVYDVFLWRKSESLTDVNIQSKDMMSTSLEVSLSEISKFCSMILMHFY